MDETPSGATLKRFGGVDRGERFEMTANQSQKRLGLSWPDLPSPFESLLRVDMTGFNQRM